MTLFIDVYKADDNFVTSGATLLSDLDLQETYRAIDSVATGRIPFLSCVNSNFISRSRKLGLHATGNTYKQTFTYVQETIVCVEGIPRVPFLVVAIALFAILGVLLDASPLAGILQLAQFGVAGWVSVQTLSTYR